MCFLSFQPDVGQNDVDPHFKRLFVQISGNVTKCFSKMSSYIEKILPVQLINEASRFISVLKGL